MRSEEQPQKPPRQTPQLRFKGPWTSGEKDLAEMSQQGQGTADHLWGWGEEWGGMRMFLV